MDSTTKEIFVIVDKSLGEPIVIAATNRGTAAQDFLDLMNSILPGNKIAVHSVALVEFSD